MKLFRTAASAFLVFLGVMMIVTWAFSVKSVQAVESGEAAENLTATLLESPEVANLAADKATDQIHDQLQAQFDSQQFELLWGLAEQPIHNAIVNVIGSDFVADAAEKSAGRIEAGLVEALTQEDRPYGPLMLSVDVSPRINARIDQIPVVGTWLPNITVAPLETEVIEAQVFEDMRNAYGAAKAVAAWFIWIGLALVILGVYVSPRRRWFFARAMFVAGGLVLAIGFTINAIGAHTIASFMPGGADGGLGTTVDSLLSDAAIPPITSLLLRLGSAALLLAVLAVLVVRFVPAFRRNLQSRREQNAVPLTHESPVEASNAGTHSGPVASSPAIAEADAEITPPGTKIATSVASTVPASVPLSTPTPDAKTLELAPEDLAAAVQKPMPQPSDSATEELTPEVLAAAAKPAPSKPVAKKATTTSTSVPTKKPAAKSTSATKKPAVTQTPVTKSATPRKSATTRKPAPKKPAPKKSEPPAPE